MVLALNWLWLIVPSEGIGQFLETRELGAWLPETAKWARRIGARQTAAYVRATLRLFPRSAVPAGHEARRRLRDRLMARWPAVSEGRSAVRSATETVKVAVAFAADALHVYPELMQSPEGRKAATALFRPFDGLISPP